MKLCQFHTHLSSQLGIQVGQRLIHEESFRLTDNGASDGHALLLSSGKGSRLSVQEMFDLQGLGYFVYSFVNFFLWNFPDLQSISQVPVYGHVGIQSIVLKYHRQPPVLWFIIVAKVSIDPQFSVADILQSCDHAQRGGLAAAGGANKDDEFLVLDIQVKVFHCKVPFVILFTYIS